MRYVTMELKHYHFYDPVSKPVPYNILQYYMQTFINLFPNFTQYQQFNTMREPGFT